MSTKKSIPCDLERTKSANSDEAPAGGPIDEARCQEDHNPCKWFHKAQQKQSSEFLDGIFCVDYGDQKAEPCWKPFAYRAPEKLAVCNLTHQKELLDLLETRFTPESFKTWQAMSEAHREGAIAFCYDAWPDEDFRIDVALGGINTDMASAYSEEFLLPYLDSKAMAQDPRTLFRMIDLHTERPPWEYINFDAKQLQRGYELGAMGEDNLQGCIRIADVTVDTYGAVEAFDAEAVHSGRALPAHPASRALEARHRLLCVLKWIVKPLVKNNNPRDAKGAWKMFAKAEFKTKHSHEDASNTILGIGYLPSFAVDDHVQAVKSQLHLAEEDLRSLYLMPELFKVLVTEMETDYDARIVLQDFYCFFDRLCGLRLLGQHLELLARLPAGEACSIVLQKAIKSITQSFMSGLLTQIKRFYFCSPTLYRGQYRKFETASELWEHDQLSGLFLGLTRNPSDATTILALLFRLLESDNEMDRLPPGLLDVTITFNTLNVLVEELYYCTPTRVQHHAHTNATDNRCLAARFCSWTTQERPQIIKKSASQEARIKALNTNTGNAADFTPQGRILTAIRQETFVERLRKRYLDAAGTTGKFSEAEIAQIESFLTPEGCTASEITSILKNLTVTETSTEKWETDQPISPVLSRRATQHSSYVSPIPHVSGLRDNVQRFRASQSVTTKEKKRGVPSPTFENADDAPTDITEAAGGDVTIQEPFEINHNDYRLVHRFWRAGRREKPEGSVRPSHLRSFMESAGFTCYPSAEGSRVDFRRTTATGNRLRFSVHIPHGTDTTFRSDQLHGMGRNMTEMLHWDASSFKLKG